MKNNSKNTITQFKLFYDFDKELEYINSMNKQGWKLVYIRGGCFYTFVKTQPDEYFTTMYIDDKSNISHVTTFAAQCGYESIPHTMDGVGTLLYLTGQKGKVSEEFSCDRNYKIKFYSKMSTLYTIVSIVDLFIALILLAEIVFFFFEMMLPDSITAFLPTLILGSIVEIFSLVSGISLTVLTVKSRKKIKQLKAESLIYE